MLQLCYNADQQATIPKILDKKPIIKLEFKFQGISDRIGGGGINIKKRSRTKSSFQGVLQQENSPDKLLNWCECF